jgi:hypothetical protein
VPEQFLVAQRIGKRRMRRQLGARWPARITHQQLAVLAVQAERERRVASRQVAVKTREIVAAQRDGDFAEEAPVRRRAGQRRVEHIGLRDLPVHRQREVRRRADRLCREEVVACGDRDVRGGKNAASDQQLARRVEDRNGRHLREVAANLAQALEDLAFVGPDRGRVVVTQQVENTGDDLLVQIEHLDGLLVGHACQPVDHVVGIGNPALIVEVSVACETGERKQDRGDQNHEQDAPRCSKVA